MLAGLSLRQQVALTRLHDRLIKELDVVPVLNGLLTKMVISHADYNMMDAGRTQEEKVKLLLDLLPKKDQQTYDEFSMILRDHQDWLHKKLNTEVENITDGKFMLVKVNNIII